MAQKTKAQLITAIDALYTDCGTECITVEEVNIFEKDKVDSYTGQVIDITKAALTTAIANSEIEIGTRYRIIDATEGVIWVYGVDANVISTNAQLEGTYDGSSWGPGAIGTYSLADDLFLANSKSFDITFTNPSEIQACASTPLQIVVAPTGKKVVPLTAFFSVEGGTTDYNFPNGTILTDSLGGISMITFAVVFINSVIEPAQSLNSERTGSFSSLTDFRFRGNGIFLSQYLEDATQGDRNVRIWGTYAELKA